MALPDTYVKGFHNEELVKKMKYNLLGNTGMKLSHIGFGGGGLADFYEKFNEEDGVKVVHEALKRGINYIDTAPYYGDNRKSEMILGKALKGIPRESYYIGTKVGRFSQDVLTGFDFTYDTTMKSVDKSLELLGLEYVDLIQAHDIEFAPDLDIVINETLPALADCVIEGKAKYIGVTGYPISVLKEAIERSFIKIDCVLCYARSTLIDMTLLDYMPSFQEMGLGVISAAGIAMSLLSNKGPFPWHPASDEIKEICAEASNICQKKGVELGKLAAFHTMSVNGPATNLFGINSMQVLEQNLDVCNNGLTQLEEDTLQELKTTCFNKIKVGHWEGFEVNRYRKQYNELTKDEK